MYLGIFLLSFHIVDIILKEPLSITIVASCCRTVTQGVNMYRIQNTKLEYVVIISDLFFWTVISLLPRGTYNDYPFFRLA
jgi:hypothetical protein